MLSKLVAIGTLLMATAAAAMLPGTVRSEPAQDLIGNFPPTFTKNEGQWGNDIKFRASGEGATVWFTIDGPYYQLVRIKAHSPRGDSHPLEDLDASPGSVEYLMIKASFVGANASVNLVGKELLDYKCNYFLGNDQEKWRTNVGNYAGIVYRNVYPGIDLRYYGQSEGIEYDFVVAPGADVSQIQVQYEGIESLSVNEAGELVLETIWGQVTELAPTIYQVEDSGVYTEISGAYTVISHDTFGFEVDQAYSSDLPLVIDPVIIFSSFLGGTRSDYGWGARVDDAGNAYLVGMTNSTDFPTAVSFQDALAGEMDLFVSKISPENSTLLFSTYFGGSAQDENPRITLDHFGNVYIAARTQSPDFPTVNAFDNSLDGLSDAIVAKISSTGDVLVFSTFLGGIEDEFGNAIDVDQNCNAYVSTVTYSEDFPVVDPFQISPSNGTKDITVSKFSVAGDALLYSTYLGGVQDDESKALVVDDNGCVYLTGHTYSQDFPVVGGFDPSMESTDAFVTKLNNQGNGLIYSSFLGGSEGDFGTGIDIDASGCAYVTGGTVSPDFPIVNAFQPVFTGGSTFGLDLFVSKVNPSGASLEYSSYLGGSDDEHPAGIKIDRYGNAFVVGATNSPDFPLVNPIDSLMTDDVMDAIISRVSSSGDELEFSTYFGGDSTDYARTLQVDDNRDVYITGYTLSNDFPLMDPIQQWLRGTRDAFIIKLEIGCCNGKRGNMNYDEGDLVTAIDVIYLVDWLFAGGNDPVCPGEVDVNDDGQADAEDLIFLVDYIWLEGAAPPDCAE
ncbi:MAG: SBBP repeat-containing protein [Candidatus Zixiibacteriota bacterium]|nr:MAG: SBBP repeat-containing protein [candidate division Zixibacteria bacterium]